jgi:carboxylate-amine ligase
VTRPPRADPAEPTLDPAPVPDPGSPVLPVPRDEGMDIRAVPTVGVEEEFFLLRPDGEAACVAPGVLRTLAENRSGQAEFMQFQVESATAVCSDLATLWAEIVRGRRTLAGAAAVHGARLAAVGTPTFDLPAVPALTDVPRYRRLVEEIAGITGREVSSACHVHVAVATPDLGVAVLNRIRGWLPVLLALSTNSPMWGTRDTGWDSYRYIVQTAWPTARLPPRCADAAAYDRLVAEQIALGRALDARSVYWFARLSPRYPTVEIRIPDVCLRTADAVLLGGLSRALVATALAEAARDRPAEDVPDELLAASVRAAARGGLGALLVDPRSGTTAPGTEVLGGLLRRLAPALDLAGDRALVGALLRDRLRRGSGAARQRRLAARLSRPELVTALATATLSSARPA